MINKRIVQILFSYFIAVLLVQDCLAQFALIEAPVDSSMVCVSSTVWIQTDGANFTDSMTLFYGDGNNDTWTANPDFVPHTYSSLGGFNIVLISYSNPLSDTHSIYITVRDTLYANFSMNNDSICLGQDIVFSNSSTGDTMTASYSWDFGNSVFSSSKNPPTHYYEYPGQYYVTLDISNGCLSSKTDTVIIFEDSLQAEFTWNGNNCPCNELPFTALGTVDTYSWIFGNNNTSTMKDPLNKYAAPGRYIASLTSINSLTGCKSTRTKNITVCENQIDTSSKSKANNNWYFGNNAGVSFNSGSPVGLTNGQLITDEGCATVSDAATGALHFYTDGSTVWNGSHLVMANGTGLNGQISNSQSALIIPMPGFDKRYYLFTNNNGWNNDGKGYFYSIVDVAKDSVIVKNDSLFLGPCPNNILIQPGNVNHEQMAGMVKKQPSCTEAGEYWIVIPSCKDSFKAFLITQSGIGAPVTSYWPYETYPILGSMVFSPNGQMLVVNYSYSSVSLLFDFDTETGQILNPRPLAIPSFYGMMVFSPDNSLLYSVGYGLSSITQFDLTAPNPNTSAVVISPSLSGGTMWIGPDNKIYISGFGGGNLKVINNPNIKGVGCNYQAAGVNLAGRTARYGLQNLVIPRLPDTLLLEAAFSIDTVLCPTDYEVRFRYAGCSFIPDSTLCIWIFGDGSIDSFPVLTYPTHTFSGSGSYDVMMILSKECYISDTAMMTLKIDSIPTISFLFDTVCEGIATNFIPLINEIDSVESYAWSGAITDSSANPLSILPSTGNHVVTLSIYDTLGCFYSYTDSVLVRENLTTIVTDDTTICSGNSVMLQVDISTGQNETPITYSWTPTKSLNNSILNNVVANPNISTTYTIAVSNLCNTDSSSVTITVESCAIYIPNVFSPNGDGDNDLFGIRGSGIANVSFKIYDRWGNKVFQAKDYTEFWDGKFNGNRANQGVYVYVVTGGFINGNPIDMKGNISLIR